MTLIIFSHSSFGLNILAAYTDLSSSRDRPTDSQPLVRPGQDDANSQSSEIIGPSDIALDFHLHKSSSVDKLNVVERNVSPEKRQFKNEMASSSRFSPRTNSCDPEQFSPSNLCTNSSLSRRSSRLQENFEILYRKRSRSEGAPTFRPSTARSPNLIDTEVLLTSINY